MQKKKKKKKKKKKTAWILYLGWWWAIMQPVTIECNFRNARSSGKIFLRFKYLYYGRTIEFF